MATVHDIVSFLDTIAPEAWKESWDNVGLLCGRMGQPVTKILVALDPFPSVIHEAVTENADLIVTHHPLIFGNALMNVTDCTETGKSLLTLIEHNIAAVNAHTNLDMAPSGVNDVLAQTLGLENITVPFTSGLNTDGQSYGLLRTGTVASQSLDRFLSQVKDRLGCPGLRYADGGKPVHRVAVGGGACGSEWLQAVQAGCDTFVTADVKYNQFWDAQQAGLTLIDAGHFYTENPVVAVLAQKLQAAFPEIPVSISKTHRDCMKFF